MRRVCESLLVMLIMAGPMLAADAPQAPALPADLDLVPRDVFGFIALRPADLSTSLLDPKLIKKLGANPAFAQLMLPSKNGLGDLELADIERAIVVLDHFDPMGMDGQLGAAAVVTARKALDPKKTLDSALPGGKKNKVGDKHYFVQGTNAFAFLGERSFLLGDEKTVVKWLKLTETERRQGPLAGALKLAATQDIVMAMNPLPLAQFLPLVAIQVPAEYQPLLHLVKSQTTVLSVSVRQELEIDLFLTLADRAARDAAAKDARDGLPRLAQLLAPLKKPLTDQGFAKTEKLVAALETALKTAPVRQEHLRLHLPVYLAIDKAAIQAAVEEVALKALDKAAAPPPPN